MVEDGLGQQQSAKECRQRCGFSVRTVCTEMKSIRL